MLREGDTERREDKVSCGHGTFSPPRLHNIKSKPTDSKDTYRHCSDYSVAGLMMHATYMHTLFSNKDIILALLA